MQRRNEKPDRDPFITYYIVWPIQGLVESIADFFKWVWHTITGAWWCDHCKAYHGRRVHKFTLKMNIVQKMLNVLCQPEDRYVCSLWMDAQSPKVQLDVIKSELNDFTETVKDCAEAMQDSAEKLVRDAYEQLYKEGVYKDLAN